MQYTPDQQKAIKDRPEGNVLVSASAGSGKTKVLVERIIDMVKNQRINIDELLVVTFTNAAAKEMRERLRDSLQAEFTNASDPAVKKHLLTQIRKVAVADITTMDAYCQKLVARYYYILGIDPNFRVLSDNTEIQLLKEQVWDNVREELYGQDADGTFAALTENFSSDRNDDGLTNVVFQMDEFANVNPDPDAWLASAANFYEIGDAGLLGSDLYKSLIAPQIAAAFKRLILTHEAIIKVSQDAELEKHELLFFDQLTKIQDIQRKVDSAKNWDDLRQLLINIEFFSLNKARIPKDAPDYQKQAGNQIKNLKKDMTTQWKKLIDGYFQFNEQDNRHLMDAAKARIEKLVTVVRTFRAAYKQAKARRHLMQFIDIEHAAYDILSDASEQGQQVRQKLMNQYAEIMTDEYQDNNRLQDAILNRIARQDAGNRFMVGDVKQSIYRFRLADPTMFVAKQHAFESTTNPDELISLSENFRSTQNVDRFTNLIFEQIMDQQVGDVDYTGKSKLKFGAAYYPEETDQTISLIVYRTKSAVASNQDADPITDEIEDSDVGQATIIAQKIRQLYDAGQKIFDKDLGKMRPVSYGDFAVISPTHNNELTLSDVFTQYGIPAEITGAKSYFKTTEIQIMMSLLAIIDNPFQDIPLVAVLRSPIVGLDENQLAYLRINRRTGNYYQAVLDFYHQFETSEPNDYATAIYPKIDRFLKQLTHFKDVAQQDGLVALIWDIYTETGYLDYVGGMPAGLQRQTNLHALYERAADYERNGFKGLFQFVQFIRRMQDHDQDLASVAPTASDNTVHVMTIHGSKGLQFPIVFLSDVGKNFNQRDIVGNYVLNDHWGIGISYLNPETREVRAPLQKQAIVDITKNASLSEEMRKLYVAMTRAEQQLYLVAKVKGDKDGDDQQLIDKWQGQTDANQLVLPAAIRNAARSYLDWIGPAIARHPVITSQFGDADDSRVLQDDQAAFQIEFYDDEKISDLAGEQDQTTGSANEFIQKIDQQRPQLKPTTVAAISQIMNFNYPHVAATKTTAYQSVSEIKRLFDDPDNAQLSPYSTLDVNQVAQTGRYLKANFDAPDFIAEGGTGQPAPTEVGTATHLVLQQVNLTSSPTSRSLQELIGNMVKQGILSEKVAKAINVDEIVAFYRDPLGKELLAHPTTTYREVPFSLLMKAKDVFSAFQENDDQRILIHGIIDGYVLVDDHVTLFDYKTDRITPKTGVADIVHRYRGQLKLYALALSKILKRPIDHQYLYLLSANRAIDIDKS